MRIWILICVFIALILLLSVPGCPNRAGIPASGKRDATDANMPAAVPPLFQESAQACGVGFKLGHDGKRALTILEIIGTGCSTCDLDGDGHADLFFVGQTAAGDGLCALYRNNGNGTFTDVTAGSGVEEPGMFIGCAVADIDSDGRPDILLTGYGIIRLYRNLGNLHFQDVTRGSGLEAPSRTSWASSAAFFDYDRDGRVDVYIGRYVIFDEHSMQYCDYGQLKASCGPLFYDPQMGSLYHNEGGFRFKDVTHATGLDAQHGKCLGAAVADVNGDGWPDLYLANDEMPGDLFINQGGKSFRDVGAESGVALAADGSLHGGMGVDFADVDHDGRLDIFVTTYQGEADALYLAGDGGAFRHRSLEMGLDSPTRMMVGFGTKFFDLDNDGWPDLVIANGHIHDNQDVIDKMTHYRQPMMLFVNQGGKAFADRTSNAGPGFTKVGVGRGLATADLDDDGLEDVVICDLEGPARVLRNRSSRKGNWLRIKLEGSKSNRMALGAKVTVVAGNQRRIAECTTAGSYLSASDPRIHFGLGDLKAVDRVEVAWPSGRRSVLKSPRVPGDVSIREP